MTELPSNRWLLTVAEETAEKKRRKSSFRTLSMKQKQVAKEHMILYRWVGVKWGGWGRVGWGRGTGWGRGGVEWAWVLSGGWDVVK